MNIDTKTQSLPTLIADLLGNDGLNIDNLFADLWKRMGVATLLHRTGFHKRSGLEVTQVVKEHKLNNCESKALVADDSVKIRRGKKWKGFPVTLTI